MKFPEKLLALMLALFSCALPLEAYGQKRAYPSYSGHVNDFANVMDAGTKQRIETILTNFERLTGTQIAAVVLPSLNGVPIEEYSEGLYETWGIGGKSGPNKNKGALLLLSIGDRKTRLEVGYALEGDLPDGLAGETIRRMRPALQQGQYGQGMELGVRTLVDTLAEKWNVNIDGIDRRFAYRAPAEPEPLGGKAILAMIGVFLLFLILMSIIARKARRNPAVGNQRGGASDLWWMAPIIFNRGGGSFGGGSWGSNSGWGDNSGGGGGGGSSGGGGGSSGGDWGGFSGGDSGGGGASDSW